MDSSSSTDSIDDIREHEHFVQLYESDTLLIKTLGKFIGDGIRAGEPCVVVATPEHIAALEAFLRARKLDTAAELADGRLRLIDSHEALSKFLVDGRPDKAKFEQSVGKLLETTARPGKTARVFGEMVAELWASDNQAGAIMLEQLWNEIIGRFQLTLFCAYPMHHFETLSHEALVRDVGRLHTTVVMRKRKSKEPDKRHRTSQQTSLFV
jgi:hypothetical protein